MTRTLKNVVEGNLPPTSPLPPSVHWPAGAVSKAMREVGRETDDEAVIVMAGLTTLLDLVNRRNEFEPHITLLPVMVEGIPLIRTGVDGVPHIGLHPLTTGGLLEAAHQLFNHAIDSYVELN